MPMGEISIPLDSINPNGDVTDQSYPLQASGRMKTVTGEVSSNFKTQSFFKFSSLVE